MAIAFVFFANGFVVASWLPHIPEVKERLALRDLELGMALFAMAVGSIMALPFAGWFVGRLGSHGATRAAGLTLCLLLPAPVLAPSLTMLILALLLFGAANGVLDVVMNAQGVLVEDRYPRPIFSSLHGLYSTGGLAAASIAALAIWGGVPAAAHGLGLTAIIAPLLLAASRALVRGEVASADRVSVLAWPAPGLIGLGALAFLALMAEGAMGDWTAVFLRETAGAGIDGAATGFAGFSLAMAIGRFSGDWVRRRWGAVSLLRVGGVAAGIGMAIALTAPGLIPSVLGFTLFGLGLANMVPVLFGAAGRAQGVTAGLGIAAVATAGYAGLLGGPPLIGLLAEVTALRLALITILVGAVAVFAGSVRESWCERRAARRGHQNHKRSEFYPRRIADDIGIGDRDFASQQARSFQMHRNPGFGCCRFPAATRLDHRRLLPARAHQYCHRGLCLPHGWRVAADLFLPARDPTDLRGPPLRPQPWPRRGRRCSLTYPQHPRPDPARGGDLRKSRQVRGVPSRTSGGTSRAQRGF